MKNTWVYNQIERFNNDPPIESNSRFDTVNILINAFCVPLLATGVIIVCLVLTIPMLLGGIVKDLYDLWYDYNEERLRKNLLSNINQSLSNYGNNLLKKENKFRLKGFSIDEKPLLNIFIKNFFINYNYKYETVNKNNKVICSIGRRRSLGDIYLICKHYYPNCTIIEVFKELIALNKAGLINMQKCGDIKKYVFYSSRMSYYNSLNNSVEYFGVKIKMSELISNIK